jgi:glycosyltransferase involved in cell wall biosynthesis
MKIAYVMSRFPHLPETFILREMGEMERQGWDIALYPLIEQKQAVVHADAERWIPKARYLPFFSWGVVAANGRSLRHSPQRYLTLWGRVVRENIGSPNFLIRALALLPKAVYAAQEMERDGIDHIHAHYATHPALVAWIIHQLTGISYSITVHAHDIFVRTDMLGSKLRDATFIAAISEYNRNHIATLVGDWVRAKTQIVHCGIVPAHYPTQASPRQPDEPLEIIAIGSLQPYKGHKYLIEACAQLRRQKIPFRCRIIGGGEEQIGLQRRIHDASLGNHVQLLGARTQEEVATLLASAHCYVQPSIVTPSGKMEGIPVALMEALASGLPVIATDLSGVPELVRPDETGYLVPPADSTALAEALTAVYHHPDHAQTLAATGRQLVLDQFELSANVRQLAHLFQQTLTSDPAGATANNLRLTTAA